MITIAMLKKFLEEVPAEFDEYTITNGEVMVVDKEDGGEDFYVRLGKPIMQIQVDESTKELCMLAQTEEEVADVLAQTETDGDTEGTE